jgi:hypothetical protein
MNATTESAPAEKTPNPKAKLANFSKFLMFFLARLLKLPEVTIRKYKKFPLTHQQPDIRQKTQWITGFYP